MPGTGITTVRVTSEVIEAAQVAYYNVHGTIPTQKELAEIAIREWLERNATAPKDLKKALVAK